MMQQSIRDLIDRIVNDIKENGFSEERLKEFIAPNGYAEQIATNKEVGLTRVQLRKIFQEFKNIYDEYTSFKKKNEVEKNLTKIKVKLYKLYPLLQYQVNRKLIKDEIRKLFFAITDKLDEDNFKNFDIAMEFIKAIVAYIPKES